LVAINLANSKSTGRIFCLLNASNKEESHPETY